MIFYLLVVVVVPLLSVDDNDIPDHIMRVDYSIQPSFDSTISSSSCNELSDCKGQCAQQSRCFAFTFCTNKTLCSLILGKWTSWGRWTINNETSCTSVVVDDINYLTDNVEKTCAVVGRKYKEASSITAIELKTYRDCTAACTGDNDCSAVTVDTSTNLCYKMTTAAGGLEDDSNSWSYPLSCKEGFQPLTNPLNIDLKYPLQLNLAASMSLNEKQRVIQLKRGSTDVRHIKIDTQGLGHLITVEDCSEHERPNGCTANVQLWTIDWSPTRLVIGCQWNKVLTMIYLDVSVKCDEMWGTGAGAVDNITFTDWTDVYYKYHNDTCERSETPQQKPQEQRSCNKWTNDAISCPPGYGYDNETEVNCSICPVLQWKYDLNNNPCVHCPANSQQSCSVEGKSSIACDPGYGVRAGKRYPDTICDACEAGKYGDGKRDFSPCTTCPTDTYNNKTKSTSPDDCTPCPTESKSPVGSRRLNQCLCDKGKEKISGDRGDPRCTICPNNKYKSWVGNGNCQRCPTGSNTSADAVSCVCIAGYMKNNTRDACQECPKGKAKETAGNESCTLCTDKKYAPTLGSVTCIQCPDNQVTSSDGTQCLCDKGYTGASCVDCPVGHFKDTTGSQDCTPCPHNTFKSIAGRNVKCDDCPTGSFSNTTGSQTCISIKVVFQDHLTAKLHEVILTCEVLTYVIGLEIVWGSANGDTIVDNEFYSITSSVVVGGRIKGYLKVAGSKNEVETQYTCQAQNGNVISRKVQATLFLFGELFQKMLESLF